MKSRIFNIMQYERHPETGEVLLTEDKIKDGLNHRTIKRYAYICHENDVYSEEDELNDSNHVAGTKKPKHWHIVIEMKTNQAEVHTIAKWFGIKENYVECAKGHGAFLDCVEYLTHEHPKQQEKGKYLYSDECVISSFNFREELTSRSEKRLKYGKDLSIKDELRYDVLVLGKSLIDCYEKDPLAYASDSDKLRKLRFDYIQKQEPPQTRINYYIEGIGGVGKGLCSRALARSLFPDIERDDELYFQIGAENTTFEGYDGQPVIIWDDCRAHEMLQILGSRGNVFAVLDTHPQKKRQNVKYASINLINQVNIINSVQPYTEFLDGLAAEYKTKNGKTVKAEDKNQSYRRMPFIMCLRETDFDLLVNKGFVRHSKEFQEFEKYLHISGNFENPHIKLKGNKELIRQIEGQILELPKQKYDEVMEEEQKYVEVTDDILEEFKNYGKQILPPPKKQPPKYKNKDGKTIMIDLYNDEYMD